MKKAIRFNLNHQPRELLLDAEESLLWVLRSHPDLNLTGTKYGCGLGDCGACTILLDNVPVRSCLIAAEDVDGTRILTIEGLASEDDLHPVQKAFIEHDALQCGYCTPGMIMQAVGFLHRNPEPTPQEIIDGMEENLCRCGAHVRIMAAIASAAKNMKGGT